VTLISGSTAGEQQSRIASPISGVAYQSMRVGDSVFGATRTTASQQWLQSPWWDSLWMLSGLWLLLIVMCAQGAGYVPLVPRLLAGCAVGLLWGGHILSPIVVGWANHGLRSHMLLHWPQFVALPVGIFLTSVFLGVLGDLSRWTVLSPMLTASLNPRLVLFYASSCGIRGISRRNTLESCRFTAERPASEATATAGWIGGSASP